jgi:hypothetical protein
MAKAGEFFLGAQVTEFNTIENEKGSHHLGV